MGKVQKGDFQTSIGKSRGGMTCKILALVDSLRNLIKFRLMPGQYHDLVETKPQQTLVKPPCFVGLADHSKNSFGVILSRLE